MLTDPAPLRRPKHLPAMRILHIYKDYAPVRGGIENHVRVLAESQAAAGHQVDVLVCAEGSARNEVLGGVTVQRAARLATLRSMPISLDLVQRLRRIHPDVFHVHSPFPLGEFALRRAPLDAAVVATHHSDVVRQRWLLRLHAPFYRRFLARTDALLPTSEAYARTSPWLRPHAAKCRVVPLGVDAERFSPDSPSRSGTRPALRLLFAGKLRYYKGVDTLLRALAALPASIQLDIVGTGPMDRAWRHLADALGLRARVRFHGEADDDALVAAYRAADIFVLPCNCRAEAFGTVLLEAMACGVPCVTCEVGSGTSWVVEHGVTGLVVPPADPVPLADAIATLDADRVRLQAYGAAGRRRVEAQFTEARMVAAVQAVYDEVVSRRTGMRIQPNHATGTALGRRSTRRTPCSPSV